MPKRISKSADINEAAYEMVRRSTGTEDSQSQPRVSKALRKQMMSFVASEMGRKGGRIGGKRRLVTMTPEQRRAIAVKAAKARWAKHKAD